MIELGAAMGELPTLNSSVQRDMPLRSWLATWKVETAIRDEVKFAASAGRSVWKSTMVVFPSSAISTDLSTPLRARSAGITPENGPLVDRLEREQRALVLEAHGTDSIRIPFSELKPDDVYASVMMERALLRSAEFIEDVAMDGCLEEWALRIPSVLAERMHGTPNNYENDIGWTPEMHFLQNVVDPHLVGQIVRFNSAVLHLRILL